MRRLALCLLRQSAAACSTGAGRRRRAVLSGYGKCLCPRRARCDSAEQTREFLASTTGAIDFRVFCDKQFTASGAVFAVEFKQRHCAVSVSWPGKVTDKVELMPKPGSKSSERRCGGRCVVLERDRAGCAMASSPSNRPEFASPGRRFRHRHWTERLRGCVR